MDAQFATGLAYSIGRGVPVNYSEAYFWLNLAAAAEKGSVGDKASEARDTIGRLLSREDLSQAQSRAMRWLDEHASHQAQ